MNNDTNHNEASVGVSTKTVTYEVGSRFEVFSITKGSGARVQRWIRLGTAFVNGDGSLNVYLDATPLDGKLNIRRASTKDAGSADGASN